MKGATVVIACVGALIIGSTRGAGGAATLSVDLSRPVIEISTGFAGADVLLFGAIEGGGDIIVVVTGPVSEEIVRRKERVFGIWVNAVSRTFETVPAYYHVASTRPIRDIAPEPLLNRFQIGVEHLRLGYKSGQAKNDQAAFRAALIRNKQRAGLYGRLFNRVGVTDKRLFRATFNFPANVPTGTYTAEVYFIRNGRVVSNRNQTLVITKVGLEASIFNFAHQQAPLYGIMAILLALLSGWLAGVIFRRA